MPRNLPNLITLSRLVLAAALFILLAGIAWAQGASAAETGWIRDLASRERLLLNGCLAIFALAALSDVLDGFVARRWGLQTDFGRIMDPFADKLVVCGVFVELIPLEGSQVSAWMVVLILARELFVDGLRGYVESRGCAFPATFSGKLKMFSQCLAISWILFALANLPLVSWALVVSRVLLWVTVTVTLLSGLDYLVRGKKVLAAEQARPLEAGA